MSVTTISKAAGGMPVFAAIAAQAATTITLQPDEHAGKDVFLYELGVDGVFDIPPPRRTNLDAQTLAMPSAVPAVPSGKFLGAGETDPFTGPGGELRQHGIRTLIGFDLGLLNLNPSMVGSAWLNLYALPALGAFESPDPMHPVSTDLHRVAQIWSETAATWKMSPSVAAMPFATVVQNGVGRWVRFDVTGLVRDWLHDPASNFGVELSQREVLKMEMPGQRDRYFASLYASSAFDDTALRACGAAVVTWIARRRRGTAAAS